MRITVHIAESSVGLTVYEEMPSAVSLEFSSIGLERGDRNTLLIQFQRDCSRHIAQKMLVRQRGSMHDPSTWAEVGESFGLRVLMRSEPNEDKGRWIHAPDAESGVIVCNTFYGPVTQIKVLVHEIAHALLCILPDLLLEIESGERLIGSIVCGATVRHKIARLAEEICLPHLRANLDVAV